MGRKVIRMPEYIDRENYCKNLCHGPGLSGGCEKAKCPLWQAPLVKGVVPVVRCKSCVYAKWSERNQSYYCQRRWAMRKVRERDFCSYGKRRVKTCD